MTVQRIGPSLNKGNEMKKLLFLMLFPVLAYAQIQPYQTNRNVAGYFQTNNGTAIKGRAYTTTLGDTSQTLSLVDHKTIYVNVHSLDSATIRISYALSDDAANWSTFTLKDSLATETDGGGLKSGDLTSSVLGARYARFLFSSSATIAIAQGTTSATYHASYVLKKQ